MIAIDIGGTYTRYEYKGKIFTLNTKDIVITDFLQKLINNYSPGKIAVSFAGQVNNNNIISSPNINFKNTDLNALAEKTGVKIIVENDMKCAALAEAQYFKSSYLAALYSGTGLGSGIIQNGKIIKGYENLAGEIGHIPYKKSPFKCGCGKDNCIELYASGSAIKKWAAYLKCGWRFENTCEKIKSEYLKALTSAAAVILTLFNPKILVLGGGVIVNNPEITAYVKKNIKYFAPSFACSNTQITVTKIKDASLKGAKILLKEMK